MQTTIQPATQADKSIIEEMLQAYALDLLQYMDIPRGDDGQFEYPELENYSLLPADNFPFLIRVQNQPAGFVFVNCVHNLVKPGAWSIEEFYVAPEFRRRGVGMTAACEVLHRFPGEWEVAVISSNTPALRFWDDAILQSAGGNLALHDWSGHGMSFQVYTFTIAPADSPIVPGNE